MKHFGARSVVAGSILLAFFPAVVSANLLSGGNWDFETPDISGPPNSVVTYTVGSTFGSWTVIGSGGVNVHHVGDNTIWPGNTTQFLDLTGTAGGGGIEWSSIATLIGQQYEVSWSAFNGSLVYSAGGTPTVGVFTFEATGGPVLAYDLAPGTSGNFTYSFVASSASTTITLKDNTFQDTNAGWVDNVVLLPIPEPGVLSLAGLSAALFAGWCGLRRRAA